MFNLLMIKARVTKIKKCVNSGFGTPYNIVGNHNKIKQQFWTKSTNNLVFAVPLLYHF